MAVGYASSSILRVFHPEEDAAQEAFVSTYAHFRITLHAFHCTHEAGEPQALGCAGWRWVRLEELDGFAFPKVDREIIKALHQELYGRSRWFARTSVDIRKTSGRGA